MKRHMDLSNGAKKAAFGGILTALAVVLLALGSVLPHGSYFLPLAAGIVVFVGAKEFSGRLGIMIYAAVSLLSFFICADKTSVCCFVILFGYYPILKPKIEYIKSRFFTIILKLVLYVAAYVLFVLASTFVFGISLTPPKNLSELVIFGYSLNMLFPILLGIAFVVFCLFYDFFLAKFYPFYDFKIHIDIMH